MLPPKLDYLFVADFADGSRYFQHPNDASITHPLTRSAFYDVLERDGLKQFTLVDRHCQHQHTVFLDDGHFKTDGKILPCPRNDLTNFRLIYFRRVQHNQENGFHVRPDVVGYFMGWQANDATGKNYQMVLEIKPLGMGAPEITQEQFSTR